MMKPAARAVAYYGKPSRSTKPHEFGKIYECPICHARIYQA